MFGILPITLPRLEINGVDRTAILFCNARFKCLENSLSVVRSSIKIVSGFCNTDPSSKVTICLFFIGKFQEDRRITITVHKGVHYCIAVPR